MNLSMNWLYDYVKHNKDIQEYCDTMTMTGSKVEGYEKLGEDISNVVVGKVLEIERHPDSDHLWICQIDVGEAEPVQIVTGAQNVKKGDMVPAALNNSTLPGGVKIKSGKLRGVPSNGMLCSLGELNLTINDYPYAEEDGIFILNEDCKPGDDIKDVLLLKDTVVEFEITPNRPDCLSVLGLARETAASFDVPFEYKKPQVKNETKDDEISNYLSVEIKEPELCPRYTARVVKNVKIAPSPKWLRARLRAAGVRPINNIVDITNYVCLEYGQPMHAFDYNFLDGKKIVVRKADDGEKMFTLDDVERTLNSSMLVISDEKKAVAVAGVMGGQNSEIEETTHTVVFESANFYGPSVRLTARALGLRTESSGRFEKGLDKENTLAAIERACELVEILGAGEVVSGIIDVYPSKYEERHIVFNAERINKFLGMDISEEFMLNAFKRLEIKCENGIITPPSFRSDLECMQDIAEEVIRIYGYDRIPSTLFKGEAHVGKRNEKQNFILGFHNFMNANGMYEIQTYSFISPKAYDKINLAENDSKRNSVVISNPLGEDTSIMRTTALANVLEALSTNRRYRNATASLYEMAKIYIPLGEGKLADEKMTCVIACYNNGDFYNLKGVVEGVLADAGIYGYDVEPVTDNPSYHPGRCACVKAKDGSVLCVFGQIHPVVADNFDFDLPVLCAEIDFDKLFELHTSERSYKQLPKFPAVTRDLAFVCDDSITSGTLKASIQKYAGKILESVEIFDVYKSDKLGENKKSMAYNLVLRASDRTLSDEDCDKSIKKVLSGLERDFGVTLRG